MTGIVVPETCWASKKYNKIISGIKLVFILQLSQWCTVQQTSNSCWSTLCIWTWGTRKGWSKLHGEGKKAALFGIWIPIPQHITSYFSELSVRHCSYSDIKWAVERLNCTCVGRKLHSNLHTCCCEWLQRSVGELPSVLDKARSHEINCRNCRTQQTYTQ